MGLLETGLAFPGPCVPHLIVQALAWLIPKEPPCLLDTAQTSTGWDLQDLEPGAEDLQGLQGWQQICTRMFEQERTKVTPGVGATYCWLSYLGSGVEAGALGSSGWPIWESLFFAPQSDKLTQAPCPMMAERGKNHSLAKHHPSWVPLLPRHCGDLIGHKSGFRLHALGGHSLLTLEHPPPHRTSILTPDNFISIPFGYVLGLPHTTDPPLYQVIWASCQGYRVPGWCGDPSVRLSTGEQGTLDALGTTGWGAPQTHQDTTPLFTDEG